MIVRVGERKFKPFANFIRFKNLEFGNDVESMEARANWSYIVFANNLDLWI